MNYWLIFIALEIGRNWYMIEKAKSKPIYFQSFIIRAMAHAFIVGLFYDVTVPSYWPSFRDILALDYFKILLSHVTSFWIFFDLGLNLSRRKDWYYRGENSGWLDRLPSEVIYWLLKIAALIYLIQWFIVNWHDL